jgi:hypothetical protein
MLVYKELGVGSNHIESMNIDKLDLTIFLILIPDYQVKTFAENIAVMLVPPFFNAFLSMVPNTRVAVEPVSCMGHHVEDDDSHRICAESSRRTREWFKRKRGTQLDPCISAKKIAPSLHW